MEITTRIPNLGLPLLRQTRPSPWHDHNDEAEAVFIHIPRTAGGSISQALFSGHDEGHATALEFQAHDAERFKKYFKFAIVRNPFDKFVSAYHRVTINAANPRTREWGRRVIGERTFDQFVDAIQNPVYRARVLGHSHFMPQSDYIRSVGDIEMDFIGRFETLAEDFSILRSRFPSAVDLGTKNASPHAGYQKYYSEKSRQAVEQIYKKDLEKFGYGFDGAVAARIS